MASGLDQNRLSLLLAVLEKRVGLKLMGEDVFVNVAGGIAVDEPAADLGIVAAVASSVRNRPIRERTAVFGEVGLAGEIRGVTSPLRGPRGRADGIHPVRRAGSQLHARGPSDRFRAHLRQDGERSARPADRLVARPRSLPARTVS